LSRQVLVEGIGPPEPRRRRKLIGSGRSIMSIRWAGAILAVIWREVGWCSWSLLGLWTALALYYTAPIASWLPAFLALGTAVLFVIAMPERFYVRGRGISWRDLRRTMAALVVTATVAFWYFVILTPDPNQEWATDHARMPHVEIVGEKV